VFRTPLVHEAGLGEQLVSPLPVVTPVQVAPTLLLVQPENFESEHEYDAVHAVIASAWHPVTGSSVPDPVQVLPVQPVWPLLMHLRLGHWLSLLHQHSEPTPCPPEATGLGTPEVHERAPGVHAVSELPVVTPGHVPLPLVHANLLSEHEYVVVPVQLTAMSAWQLVDGSGVPVPVHGPLVHWPALMHLPLRHWLSIVQRHEVCVESQTRPEGQAYVGVPAVHDVGKHCPAVAPTHAYVVSWQSALVAHGSLHVPEVPGCPVQVWP
jgi:hypothetical protein